MFATLVILSCIGAATIGGAFFAFSTFVTKALAQLPANQGVAAVQRINVVVLNPLFLGVFVGSALLSGGLAVAALWTWMAPRSPLLLAAGILYVVGCFLATMRLNVPMNERLARIDAGSPEAAEYWPTYVRDWTNWNHVRTAASLASAACSAASLAV
jgi:uncharacterized membrane protein